MVQGLGALMNVASWVALLLLIGLTPFPVGFTKRLCSSAQFWNGNAGLEISECLGTARDVVTPSIMLFVNVSVTNLGSENLTLISYGSIFAADLYNATGSDIRSIYGGAMLHEVGSVLPVGSSHSGIFWWTNAEVGLTSSGIYGIQSYIERDVVNRTARIFPVSFVRTPFVSYLVVGEESTLTTLLPIILIALIVADAILGVMLLEQRKMLKALMTRIQEQTSKDGLHLPK